MNGLKTARALVIDDTPDEAFPVIKALGRCGVGALFHTGDNPDEVLLKHRGIRLMVLDMVLENLGATHDNPQQCASTLIGVLAALVEDDYNPVVVICWTKHKDIKDAFEAAFRNKFPNFHTVSVLLFEKQELLDNPDVLRAKLQEAIDATEPFSLLLDWEQQVHDAASKTTSHLSHLVFESSDANKPWKDRMYEVCASLAIAERGTRAKKDSAVESVSAFFESLNPLLFDRLELGNPSTRPAASSYANKLLAAVTKEAKKVASGESLLPEKVRASLNSMLLLAPPEDSPQPVTPGNIYLWHEHNIGLGGTVPGAEWIDWPAAFKSSFKGNPAKAIPVLIEMTPVCDFAQSKAAVSRLVAGYVVPYDEFSASYDEKRAYLWTVGPVAVSDPLRHLDGLFSIVANARYFIAAPIDKVKDWPLFRRLRHNGLAELVSFVAHHISRVPMMKVEP